MQNAIVMSVPLLTVFPPTICTDWDPFNQADSEKDYSVHWSFFSFFLQTIRTCDCAEGECHACDMYVDQLQDVLRFSMPNGKVGAFIAEAIQVRINVIGFESSILSLSPI